MLMRQDSTVFGLAETETGKDVTGKPYNYFSISVPEEKNSDFILKITANNYTTVHKPFKLKWIKKGTKLHFGEIPLRRQAKSQLLGEATVTATKIKFYMKGDTLVYNADAFQLQEGSMLDGLIAQLPGAELTADGRIYVNGRYVESLLLNGRDFFKGDNTVLLDNLPAYMVENVKVYEKASQLSEALGKKVEEGQFVMDVKLKRQYEIGWLGNAELGGGTEKRYLGRIFAMRYTPQSNVTIFGNMNNVNDRRKPDGRGGWGDFDPTGGLTATKRAGMSYSVYDKRNRYQVNGNADVNYTDNDYVRGGRLTEFLDNGNAYNYLANSSFSDNLNISTYHYFQFRRPNHNSFSLTPQFSYFRNHDTGESLTGTYDSPLDMDYTAVLDSLFSPDWASAALHLIKRNGERFRSKGYGSSGRLSYWTFIKRQLTYDGFTSEGAFWYDDNHYENFNHFVYNYYDGNTLQQDFRNRYYTSPEKEYGARVLLRYIWHVTERLMFQPAYTFNYGYTSGDRLHYRLDLLDDSDGQTLGWLPSQAEALLRALDHDNSYTGRQHKYTHSVDLNWQWNRDADKDHGKWYIQLRPSLNVEQYDFAFTNNPMPQNVRENYFLPQLDFTAENTVKSKKHYWKYHLNLSSSAPSMLNLVDKSFTDDPLNISVGNPELKSRYEFYHTLNYQPKAMNKHQRNFFALAGYSYTWNAVAMSYVYDKASGVRTSRPVNVDGNWYVWLNSGFNTPLDKQKRLTLNTSVNTAFYHNVDYASTDAATAPTRTATDRFLLNHKLGLDYRFGKVSFGAKSEVAYNHTNTSLGGFERLNTWNIKYGLNAVVDLPWHFQVSTELNMLSRRGFESSDMNTDDVVWNARISKSVWKSRLTFMLDAWDILGNLSNISVGNNSSTHWEYTYNVIPRYVMLRLVYRLDIQPKKK